MYSSISSSISNFAEKIDKRYGLKRWRWWNLFQPTIFWGMYHLGDYMKFEIQQGPKIVFWAGSDILNLEKNEEWQHRIAQKKAVHICENEVEKARLERMGVSAKVQPVFFDDIESFPVSFQSSSHPHVFMTAHESSKDAYGVGVLEKLAKEVPGVYFHVYGIEGENKKNVFYHGQVSNDQFNDNIRYYQAAIRLNKFDGFSEIIGKSVLMGQYPISTIYYPHIDYAESFQDIVYLLEQLKNKKEPNIVARNYWYNILKKSL